jgi:hypothetical protein
MKYLIASLLIVLFSLPATARPVSYPEGWTVMLQNDIEANSSHIHYSPTAKYSIGWRHEYLRENSVHVDTLQMNNLLKRWNKPQEQANFYLKSGLGVARQKGDYTPAAFTGIALDWETRRYFTSYENRFFWTDESDKFVKHKARVGIAPYIGNYGDLHTWLMLETEYNPGAHDDFSVTPLVRFFKGNTLVEAGYNLDDGIQFNFIQRF